MDVMRNLHFRIEIAKEKLSSILAKKIKMETGGNE
jgi:hypothetical protein